MLWKCGKHVIDLSRPAIMGILNVTPDSFSDGGLHNALEDAVAFAKQLVAQGADIIDVGGETTRPGATEVAVDEELQRVVPVVQELASGGIAVSVDTRHAEVARASLEAGACIINDVSGFRSQQMCDVVAASDCGLVVMHMQGEPGTMQQNPHYDDVVEEVGAYLLRAARKLEAMGIDRARICLDPGVGFGKTHVHNAALLAATRRFASMGYPLMVAVSRKSYIGAMTGIEKPAGRDEASALCAAAAFEDGAHIARVHNVAATRAAVCNSRRAVIGLGSNQGNGQQQLDSAIAALRKLPGVWVDRVSSYVESEPAYYEDQANFTNAVALVQTTLSPQELLDALHVIENEQGRVRTIANGPRTLDLDIEDYEGVVTNDPKLTLPHPRILERDFVVTPLLEVLPSAVLADGTEVTREHIKYGTVIA